MAAVELIPKALVVGVLAAIQPGPQTAVTQEKLNRIWAELAPRHGYRQLQMAPDGTGAQFLGATPDDGAIVQPPLVQVRSSIRLGAQNAADEAQVALKSIASHLGVGQFFNLGIKHVYHAPAPENDARGFLRRRVLNKEDHDLGGLERGGELWAGLKYGINSPDGSIYLLQIEPWLADNQFVFIELDAQFPGPVQLDTVRDRARDAEQYLTGSVKQYLDDASNSF